MSHHNDAAARWHHIYVDLCGHGESTRDAEHYSVERFARDMIAMLDELGVQEVVCVGHSLGGMIGQAMAHQAPERIKALVLADTTYSTSSTRSERFQTFMARALFRVLSVERLAEMSAKQLGAHHPDVAPMIYAEMMKHADDHHDFLAMWRAIFDFDSRPWLFLIQCPVLLLIAQDNKATRAQREGFVQALPDVRVAEIPRSGHMLNWDNPEAFNETIATFICEVSSQRS